MRPTSCAARPTALPTLLPGQFGLLFLGRFGKMLVRIFHHHDGPVDHIAYGNGNAPSDMMLALMPCHFMTIKAIRIPSAR